MAVLALPHRQGRAPVALAAQAPVDHVLQEVAHPAFLDVVRHPVDGPVVPHEVVPQLRHLDEPGRPRVVEQRRVAAPAEGIVVREGHRREQQAAVLQVLKDQRIRVLDEGAGPGRPLDKPALGVHQVHEGQAVLAAYPVVVLTEGGGDMHDARAVLHGDVVVADHIPGLFIRFGEAVKRLVLRALQLGTGELRLKGEFLAVKYLLAKRLRHDVLFPVRRGKAAVGIAGIHAQGQVARQRPGRGRPGQEEGVLLPLHREADEGGRLFDVLVALGHLVRAQRGPAAGAVGHDLVALIEQAFFGDLLQAPPLGFDIGVFIGDVGMLHVDPVADLLGHLFPLVQVFPYALLALGDERLDAVLLDLGFPVQAQGFLDLQLHGQAVGIPAGLAQDALALHGPVPRDQVLDNAGLDMADMRLAVGCGRAVKEREALAPVPMVKAFPDDVLFLPQSGDRLLP